MVAFVTDADTADRVAVRDRAAGTTLLVAEPSSSHPAVSDNGCVVAYLVEIPAVPEQEPSRPTIELRVLDRCAATDGTLGESVLVRTVDGTEVLATPALTADGTIVVWSTGTDIVRHVRFTNALGDVVYLADETFDPLGAGADILPADAVTGAGVDVSDDGNVVAFVAGPGPDRYGPRPPDVYVWSDDPSDSEPAAVELASMRAAGDPVDPAEPRSMSAGAAFAGPPPADDPAGTVAPSSTAPPATIRVGDPEAPDTTPAPPVTDPPADPPIDPPTTDEPSGTSPSAGSTAPRLSGDGAIVVFQSSDVELAAVAGNPEAVVPFVVMYQRGMGSAVLDYDARNPAISADGHHAVYDHDGVIAAIRWSDGVPFGVVTREVVFGTADTDPATTWESLNGPVVSAHGRAVVFDSGKVVDLTSDPRFQSGDHVWVRLRTQEAGGPAVDLGSVAVPGALSGSATITNTGSAGIPISAVVVDAPFKLTATTCAGVLHPGLSCTADVTVDLTTAGALSGSVRLTGGTPATEFTVGLTATGTRPSTTTIRTTTTIRVRPPVTTRPPRPTTPTTRPPTVTVATSPPTVTTLPAPAVFNPATFEFVPTIVNAGRRTATVDLFNPAQQDVTVLAVSIEPATGSAFVVDGSACVGQPLTTGGACAIGVEFAPTVEGSQSATILADLSDGARATMTVSGVGAPPPTLTVTPDVAADGQVVSVEGAGFPAGGAVELSWDGGRVVSAPVADEVGGFVETLVVLPNTARGPTEIIVFGQVDQFADVTTDLLVSAPGSRAGVPVFGGFGPSLVR